MTHYIPFLKAKRGEFNAMSKLASEIKQAICPFFDFPRKKEAYGSASYASKTRSIAVGLKKHWGTEAEFYFDDLDIAAGPIVEDEEAYAHVLNALAGSQVIPVVGLGRESHNNSVVQLKQEGKIASSVVAFRAVQDDFEDFELNKDQIADELASVFAEFDSIDLIFDCRVCTGLDVTSTVQQIVTFAHKIRGVYNVRRVIVTGSSIPASLGDIMKSNSFGTVSRRELDIISGVRKLSDADILTGDYATVSPFYSDADFDPRLFQKVTAPRLIYTFDHSHYIARGMSLELGGQSQYVGLTGALCGKAFYRGRGYSSGEGYFDDKRRSIGNNATNGTIVTPSIVAHVTYMVLDSSV